MRTLFNPTDTPVIVDDEGRVLPGLTRSDDPDAPRIDLDTPEVTAALDSGRLVLLEETAAAPDPDPETQTQTQTQKAPAKKAAPRTEKEA